MEDQPEERKTEQALLDLAGDFKETIEKKNELIRDLKKSLMVLYSLIRVADENHDPEMMCQARQSGSEFIDTFFFPED